MFLPRLTARSAPGFKDAGTSSFGDGKVGRRARSRDKTEVCPSEGKPYRLMIAASFTRRNSLGLGFPGYKFGHQQAIESTRSTARSECTIRLSPTAAWNDRAISDTYLWFGSDAADFYPAKAKIKAPCIETDILHELATLSY